MQLNEGEVTGEDADQVKLNLLCTL